MPRSFHPGPLRTSSALFSLVCLGLIACAPKEAAPPASFTDLILAPPVGSASRATLPPSRLRPLFAAGSTPSLFPVPAGIELGMPVEQAKRIAPDLFSAAPTRAAGLADVRMKGESDAYDRLGALILLLPRQTALADVMALWGDPVKGFESSSKSILYWWFDPTAHLRARLENDDDDAATSRLVLERYLPIAELVGAGRDKLGFEQEPLLGMTEERAAQVYRAYLPPTPDGERAEPLCRSEILMLPPVEYDSVFTRVRVQCGGHSVRSYTVMVRYKAHLALKDEIASLLRRKLGAPTTKKDIMGRDGLDYPVSMIRVRFREDDVVEDAIIEVASAPSAPR